MKTTPEQIGKMTQEQILMIEDGILFRLIRTGEKFVEDARREVNIDTAAFGARRKKRKDTDTDVSPGQYLPDTGNLQSSINYFVMKNGEIISQGQDGKEMEGVSAAKSLITQVETVGGYQLIGVAGMDYASYLESKGFNVITSQSVTALETVEKKLKAYAAEKGLTDVNVSIQGVSVQWNRK